MAAVAGNEPRSSKARRWQALTGAKHFEAALKQRSCARSEHFSVHRVPKTVPQAELSTSSVSALTQVVDDSDSMLYLGLVVPKRHAKRAVTRNLIKRQIRAAVQRHLESLPKAMWVVRLRAPIDRKQFPSARSDALARALWAEIEPLVRGLTTASR